MNAVRVIALASAAWAFAVAAAVFTMRPGVVILSVGVAATASCWIIANHVASRLKRELLAELQSDVRQMR